MTLNAQSTCLITGAGRGIGLELTRQALSAGATVIATIRDTRHTPAELQSLERESGGRLRIESLDVNDDASAKALATRLNGVAIDVLINNAGILQDVESPLETLALDAIRQQFDTNTLGPVRVTQALLPHLRKAKSPIVANITSLMGSIADNESGRAYGYRMSKTALNMFTKCLSKDEPGILTVGLHPGWVQTRMGGAGASVPPAESVAGLLKVLSGLRPEDSGAFLDFRGKSLPW